MKITVLVDNKTENPVCEAEWGLSLFVESQGKKVLFDTGASDMFVRNAKKIGVNLRDVEAVVVSHGHSDHTDGMPRFMEVNQQCKMYLHQNALRESFDREDENTYVPAGVRWSSEFVERMGERIVFTHDKVSVMEGIDVIGDIPQLPHEGESEDFCVKIGENTYIPDDMSHEQIMVVTEGEKVYVFSGCSHNGVVSILELVKKLYPDKEIGAFIAGMHLYSYSKKNLDRVLSEMEAYGVQNYVPLHCTGMRAIVTMKEQFGPRCIIMTSGDTVEI